MDIKTMQYGAWANSERHGFHEDDKGIPLSYLVATKLMLAVSELSESLEEIRDQKPLLYFGPNGKPEGIAAELADVVIRVGDLSEIIARLFPAQGLDLQEAIRIKMEYNAGRPYKHGKTL